MVSKSVRILVCALFGFLGSASVFAATGPCDRACLKSTLDQYLNAVIKHDPTGAPLWVGFRETDNTTVVKAGNGVWKSITGLGKVQRRYLDEVNQSAGYFGTIEEGGVTSIATLRIKVENRLITEAEWVIGRTAAGQGRVDPDNLLALMPPDVPVPVKDRTPRDVMIAAVNSYFDGVETHDGSVVMAIPGCIRLENGITTAGRHVPVPGSPGQFTIQGGCNSNFERLVQAATVARRFPVIDEEAGFALGMTIFMRAPGSPLKRNMLTEWFQIDHNRIKGIYASMYYPDQEAPAPNWPPYETNWPLPSTFAPAVPPGQAPPAPAAGQAPTQ